ncbi:hypothetical protein BC938DRAFT_474264 [Jimgerdemannia flammicorona]|uniref:Uncharacterized protein n=1 Tax=Jimgerdemannia flammicorona TaxID=994334 RepID=A0A433QSR2_9FUNG|nr:hypothetical protein BC938DRAFT_474264 [Jimgerdemannia flammicorona]
MAEELRLHVQHESGIALLCRFTPALLVQIVSDCRLTIKHHGWPLHKIVAGPLGDVLVRRHAGLSEADERAADLLGEAVALGELSDVEGRVPLPVLEVVPRKDGIDYVHGLGGALLARGLVVPLVRVDAAAFSCQVLGQIAAGLRGREPGRDDLRVVDLVGELGVLAENVGEVGADHGIVVALAEILHHWKEIELVPRPADDNFHIVVQRSVAPDELLNYSFGHCAPVLDWTDGYQGLKKVGPSEEEELRLEKPLGVHSVKVVRGIGREAERPQKGFRFEIGPVNEVAHEDWSALDDGPFEETLGRRAGHKT